MRKKLFLSALIVLLFSTGGFAMTIYQMELDTGDETISFKLTENEGKLYGMVRDDSGRTDLSISGVTKELFFKFTVTDESNTIWAVVEGTKNEARFTGKMIRGKRTFTCKGIFLPDYTGQWSADMEQGSFDITLYQTGAIVEGYHSFVNHDASRIDAGDIKGGEYSLLGKVQKDGNLSCTIKTMYGYSEKNEDMLGLVRGIRKHDDEIEWNMTTAPKVMHYLPASITLRRYQLLSSGSFAALENRYVMFQGEITGLINQHMITMNEAYPFHQYVDTDIGQLVVYSKEEIPEKTKVTIYGKLIKIGGGSKKPGEQERKYYYEYQVEAHRWVK